MGMATSLSEAAPPATGALSADRRRLLAALLVGPFMAQADATIANVTATVCRATLTCSVWPC